MILQKFVIRHCLRSLEINKVINRITRKVSHSSVRMAPIFKYPVARRDETIKETIFGVEVCCCDLRQSRICYILSQQIADPYRYLEDPDSEETKKYVDDSNAVSVPFLEDGEAWKKVNIFLELLKFSWNFSLPLDQQSAYSFVGVREGDFDFDIVIGMLSESLFRNCCFL
jgi:hypothetical protein